MNFVRPEYFVGLMLIPIMWGILVVASRRNRADLRTFGGKRLERPTSRMTGLPLLSVLLLVCLALAGPLVGEKLEEVPVRGLDVVVLLDASRSMAVADENPTRLDRGRRELIDFTERFQGGRLALVTFGGDGDLVCPLTSDRTGFASFLREVDPVFVHHGGTDLARGLRRALEAFDEDSDAEKVVLLVSDGEHLGDPEELSQVAWAAYGKGVTVHGLLMGTESGGPIPIRDRLDGGFVEDEQGTRVISSAHPELLEVLVNRTGGDLIFAADETFPLSRLEERRFSDVVLSESGFTHRWHPVNRYRWPLALAAFILLAPFLSWFRLRRWGVPASLLLSLPFLLALDVADSVEEGNRLLLGGDPAAALACYRQVSRDTADGAALSYNEGVALYQLKRYDDAAVSFERALSFSSGNTPAGADIAVRASFGAGVSKARLAEELLQATDRETLGRAVLLLTAAQLDLVNSISGGAGHAAAVDVEVVGHWLEEIRNRQRADEPPGTGNGKTDPKAGEVPQQGDPTQTGQQPDVQSPEQGEPRPLPQRSAGTELREGGGGSPARDREGQNRLPGGLLKEEARNLEDIVNRYERERREMDRRRAQKSRSKTERDW